MADSTPLERLEASLSDPAGVYTPAGREPEAYFAEIADDIRRHRREPFFLSAVVAPPGFPDLQVGSVIGGICVASSGGYWLVYSQERDHFLCFWGTDPNSLSAPGIFGSPLYCWTA